MSRQRRYAPGGTIFHVLNRSNDRRTMFDTEADYAAFLKMMLESNEAVDVGILAYCLMPNHWHMVLRPSADGHLGTFMQRLTGKHARRWRLFRGTVGEGHLYQDRYRSFPIQADEHLYAVCRYVERNPLRANLVSRAEEWPWSSLAKRVGQPHGASSPPLAAWPVPMPDNWVELVNQPQTEAELGALRRASQQGKPYGEAGWGQTPSATEA